MTSPINCGYSGRRREEMRLPSIITAAGAIGIASVACYFLYPFVRASFQLVVGVVCTFVMEVLSSITALHCLAFIARLTLRDLRPRRRAFPTSRDCGLFVLSVIVLWFAFRSLPVGLAYSVTLWRAASLPLACLFLRELYSRKCSVSAQITAALLLSVVFFLCPGLTCRDLLPSLVFAAVKLFWGAASSYLIVFIVADLRFILREKYWGVKTSAREKDVVMFASYAGTLAWWIAFSCGWTLHAVAALTPWPLGYL